MEKRKKNKHAQALRKLGLAKISPERRKAISLIAVKAHKEKAALRRLKVESPT